LAGGSTAEQTNPHWDIMNDPGVAAFPVLDLHSIADPVLGDGLGPYFLLIDGNFDGDYRDAVDFPVPVAMYPVLGPYSLLDVHGNPFQGAPLVGVPAVLLGSGFYKSIVPGNGINMYDAPMPPALLWFRMQAEGVKNIFGVQTAGAAGFFKEAGKNAIYWRNDIGRVSGFGTTGVNLTNPYYQQLIPATIFTAGDPVPTSTGGYYWDSYCGSFDPNSCLNVQSDQVANGPYVFWNAVLHGVNPLSLSKTQELIANGTVLFTSIPVGLADEWVGVLDAYAGSYGPTDMGRTISVYTDNHGEAMAYINGDLNLGFDECPPDIAQGSPHCDKDQVVGHSDVVATAIYPDNRKHPAVSSNVVHVDWTWGGYKIAEVLDTDVDSVKIVVIHLKDRDGFCAAPSATDPLGNRVRAVSINPVLGEEALFIIESADGAILSGAEDAVMITRQEWTATVFNPAARDFAGRLINAGIAQPVLEEGECQVWVKVSNSLLTETNVVVTLYDPEGAISMDVPIDFSPEVIIALAAGWNLITWTASTQPVAEGLASIEGLWTALYGWVAPTQDWLRNFPDGPGIVINLVDLVEGEAYWIYVTEATTIVAK
jgi:hypothetical protein